MRMITYKNCEEQIIIVLPEVLSSENAEELELELVELINEIDDKELVLDADKLKYMSLKVVRGLFAILRKKSNVRIINVYPNIYEILDTVGITTIALVEKKLKYIDVDNLELLGVGMYGFVYRIDEDYILKVFKDQFSKEYLEKKILALKHAFLEGIPTILSFEVVETRKGLGVIYELLDSECLSTIIHKNPAMMDKYAKKFVDVAKQFATVKLQEGVLTQYKTVIKDELNTVRDLITSEEYEILLKYLDAVPDRSTVIHGDCQPSNIMMLREELIFIDMDDFACGHPIWDVAVMYRSYQLMANPEKSDADKFLVGKPYGSYEEFYSKIHKMDIIEAGRLWNLYFKYYFDGYTEQEQNAILELIEFYAQFIIIRTLLNVANRSRSKSEIQKVKLEHSREYMERMKQKDFDEIVKLFEVWR